jgi:hypothetical protein
MKLKNLSKTKHGKAPGMDNIPPELLEDTDLTANILCNLENRKRSPKNGEKAFYLNYHRKEMFLTVQIGEELHYFLRSGKYSLESYMKE